MARKEQMAMAKTQTATDGKGKRGRRAVDPNETPEQKLRRLTSLRVSNTIKQIRGVKRLAKNYDYTEDQKSKILLVLSNEFKALQEEFAREKGKKASSHEPLFTL